jgi:hypothetical protein
MSRTVDLCPTWEAAARIYLMVLENRHAPEASRDAARTEIMRLAKAFDATQADLEVEPEPEPDAARWQAERRWHAAAARDELDLC